MNKICYIKLKEKGGKKVLQLAIPSVVSSCRQIISAWSLEWLKSHVISVFILHFYPLLICQPFHLLQVLKLLLQNFTTLLNLYTFKQVCFVQIKNAHKNNHLMRTAITFFLLTSISFTPLLSLSFKNCSSLASRRFTFASFSFSVFSSAILCSDSSRASLWSWGRKEQTN